MRKLLNIIGGSSIIVLATAFLPTAAAAQNVDGQTEADEKEKSGFGEIVVYAQRKSRGEKLQDVPMAITAVDAKALEQAHAVDIRDVGRLVPNAQLDGVGTFPGFANFFMRGVGVSTSVRSLDPAVNIVQDGMVIGYQAGAILDTFDTESVEILRGPQGVLFGRNASGGLVSLRSKRPTGDFGAEAKLTFGNAGTVETRTAVEGALVEDKVMARVAVLTRNNNGFFTSDNNGSFVVVPTNPNPTGAAAAQHPEEHFPEVNEVVAKTTWVFKPGDATTFTLMGQYLKFKDGGGTTRSSLPEGASQRQQQTGWGWTPEPGKWGTNLGTTGFTDIEGFHIIGELEQDVGAGLITAVGAYRDISYDATLNVGGDPFDVLLFPDNEEDATQKSFELRYNVDLNDRISLLLGGFYFNLDSNVFEKRLQKLPTTTTRRYTANIWEQNTESYAFFGNLDFAVTDTLTLSAGVRYSKDTKKLEILPLTICPEENFDSCPRNFLNAKKTWDDVSPRFVANWEVAPDIRVFASYSAGYRAGNFNVRAPTPAGAVTPANPEAVSSYEAGVKSDLLDNTLRINANYFYQKYDDIQRLVQTPILGGSPEQRLFNAASATIQGIELETAFMPVYGLRIDANLGYIDAQYDSFNNFTLPAGIASASDLKFDRVPKWTAYIGFTYDIDVGAEDTLSLHSGYSWRSHVFTDVSNDPLLEQDAYGLLDASVTYEHNNWTFGIFGRNIANQEYAEIKSAGLGYNAFGGSPRYYGVEIGMKL